MANKDVSASKALTNPDDVLNGILKANSSDRGQIDAFLSQQFHVTPAVATLNINGFESKVAHDLYNRTGNLDAGRTADSLAKILGDSLYELIKRAANCAGLDDEAAYLSQELWYIIESEKFDPAGATEPRNKDIDDEPTSVVNKLLNTLFKKTVTGGLVRIARAYEVPREGQKPQIGVSNLDALRWGLLNHFEQKLQTGKF